FTDLEVTTRAKLLVRGVADVVAANEEAVELLGNPVDAPLQLLRPQVCAVAEDATLGVIASFNKFYGLSEGQHFGAPFSEPLEIFLGDKSGALVEPDQILNCVVSVAGDGREILLGNCEDASPRFVREAVVEDADFSRAGRVALDDKRGCRLLQIGHCLLLRADKLHADAPLTDVGLEDEWIGKRVLFAESLKRSKSFGRSGPV